MPNLIFVKKTQITKTLFDSGNAVLGKTFTPPLPHPHPPKKWTRNVVKKPNKNFHILLSMYGLKTIGTRSAHQTKSKNKHFKKPNKKLPNVTPNISTNSIRHKKYAPKIWFLSLCHTFHILSHTSSHFLKLPHTFSYFLTLSSTSTLVFLVVIVLFPFSSWYFKKFLNGIPSIYAPCHLLLSWNRSNTGLVHAKNWFSS